jgi:hypothetical protein
MTTAIQRGALVAAAIAVVAASGTARATTISVSESTFTVAGPAMSTGAFCASGTPCDFSTPAGGSPINTVNAPQLAGTSTPGVGGLLPTVTSTPNVNGVNGSSQLEWWRIGTYSTGLSAQTTVSAGAVTNANLFVTPPTLTSTAQSLFASSAFFPPGGNDVGKSLTAEFSGTVNVNAAGTLVFSGNVDDNVLIYVNETSGNTTGAYTLIGTSALRNQASAAFSDSVALGAGTYSYEIFYADRSSTQAIFDLDAAFTASVPEASTWAMMLLGFMGVGFMAYRRNNKYSLRVA